MIWLLVAKTERRTNAREVLGDTPIAISQSEGLREGYGLPFELQ